MTTVALVNPAVPCPQINVRCLVNPGGQLHLPEWVSLEVVTFTLPG